MLRKIFKALVVLSLPLQILILQWVAGQPEWVEQFYTDSFFKNLSRALRFAFGGFAFPVGQLLFYFLIAGTLVWIGWLIKKVQQKTISIKQFLQDFTFGALAILSVFYFLFNAMWGLNYYRKPVHELTQLNTAPFSRAELEAMCVRLIALTNQSRRQISTDTLNPLLYPLSHHQILTKAPLGFRLLAQTYPALQYVQPSVKSVLVPELMSYFGITGIYFPFTGEANVNMDPPAYLLPETVCHEMAHQIGIAPEDEANFVAYLACQFNPEPAFRYSGNLIAMRYTINRLYWEDSTAYYQHLQTLSPGVICDLEKSRQYWDSFENPIEIAGRFLHHIFLKANNQTEGVRTYSRVVELLMGEFRKNGLIYPQVKKPEMVFKQ